MVSAEALHDNEETDKLLSENCFQRITEDNNSSDDAQDKHRDQGGSRICDEDLLHVDPFCHKIEMPTWMWIRTYIFTILILPIRIVLLFTLIVLSWIVASIGMIGKTDSQKPFTGWTGTLQIMAMWLGRAAFRVTGFLDIKIKGKKADSNEAPILVVAPHSTFLDGFVVFWSDLPYIVSRVENKKIPFLGKCIEFTQALFVSREDPNSRQNTVKEIIRRTEASATASWPQLIIFPEGSCSNRQALMTFKPGAFYPGKPIQPVLIRYPNKTDTLTWTWKQPHGAKSIIWLTMTQFFQRAELEYLPVYTPSQAEIADPKLFAKNVRDVMARALGVPTSDLTFEEIKEKYGKFYKKKDLLKKKSD